MLEWINIQKKQWVFWNICSKMHARELGAYHSQGNTFERIVCYFAFFHVYQIFFQVRPRLNQEGFHLPSNSLLLLCSSRKGIATTCSPCSGMENSSLLCHSKGNRKKALFSERRVCCTTKPKKNKWMLLNFLLALLHLANSACCAWMCKTLLLK